MSFCVFVKKYSRTELFQSGEKSIPEKPFHDYREKRKLFCIYCQILYLNTISCRQKTICNTEGKRDENAREIYPTLPQYQ